MAKLNAPDNDRSTGGSRIPGINPDRLESRLEKWSSGSMILAVAVALALGFLLGAIIF